MKKVLIGIATTVLGVAAMLTWWTIHPGPSHTQAVNKIPATVWGGGPTTISVEAESSTVMGLGLTLTDHSKPLGEQPMLDASESAPAGVHSWTFTVPDKVGGYIELKAEHPKAGDWLKWKVSFNGSVVKEEKEVMDQDLKANEAFFLQVYYMDFSKAVEESGPLGAAPTEQPTGEPDNDKN